LESPANNSKAAFQPFKGYRPFMLAVLFVSLYLAFQILRPFLDALILAIVLASIFYPFKPFLLRLFRGRENAVALTAVVALTILVIIPGLFFLSALVVQGIDAVNKANQWITEGNIQKILKDPQFLSFRAWFEEHPGVVEFIRKDLPGHLLKMSKDFGQVLLTRGAGLLKNVTAMIFYFFVMIFVLFYMVRDGEKMMRGVKDLSPLKDEQENRIVEKVRGVARSVLLGSFLTALCQGVVGGIGLAIVGIPPLFWGTLLGFSSLMPVVGTALVWVPATAYLALTGAWKSAVFFLLWSIVLVGSIDNFLRPFLMRGQGRMSPFYVFLAIVGGVNYFGIVGILYGPLILGFASVMLYIYRVEYREMLDEKD